MLADVNELTSSQVKAKLGLSLYSNHKAGINGFWSCNFRYSVNNLFLT